MRNTFRRCIVFVPGKRQCRLLYTVFSRLLPCTYVYADLPKREENIEAFRKGEKRYIFATSVLERGVTIAELETVVILDYYHTFDAGNIVQMVGRIGRGINDRFGKAYVMSDVYSKEIRKAISYLKEANSHL